jgi:hypothetical protein
MSQKTYPSFSGTLFSQKNKAPAGPGRHRGAILQAPAISGRHVFLPHPCQPLAAVLCDIYDGCIICNQKQMMYKMLLLIVLQVPVTGN